GSTISSSPSLPIYETSDYFLEEFADELLHFAFPLGIDYLPFDIKSNLREIEYLLNHDPIEEMDSILEDSVDKISPDDNLVDTISKMFTDEHALDFHPHHYGDCPDFEASRACGFCPSFTRASNLQLYFGNPISKSYRLTLIFSTLNKWLRIYVETLLKTLRTMFNSSMGGSINLIVPAVVVFAFRLSVNFDSIERVEL
ncbi:hypothetical protein Tco_0036210, partial [Tanacetum coccineum]